MAEKINYKAILNDIKQRYDTKDLSFEWFVKNASRPELGIYDIDYRNKKLDLRGEKTASTTVSAFLQYCDFGVESKRYDAIHLIQSNNPDINFVEAIKLLISWEEQPIDQNSQEVKRLISSELIEPKKAPYSEKMIEFQKKTAEKNPVIFNRLLKGLFRSCSDQEIQRGVNLFNIGLNEWTPEDEEGVKQETQWRLFIPEYDDNEVAYGSFRYSRELNPKGLLRKNCKRTLFGSHLLYQFNESKPIIFDEGHSDTMVNNSKGLQAVTSGSSTTEIGEEGLSLLEGRTLHIFPDADMAGLRGACHKIIEIEKFNETAENKISYKIFWWSTSIRDKVSNLLISDDDIIKEQTKIFQENGFKAPVEAMYENWKVLLKEEVQQGFDFIDFHNKRKNHPRYQSFLDLYRY